jgi:hypothetical protein
MQVYSDLSTDHQLSTAFHSQTDGQTECQNQATEQYLWAFCNHKQDTWVKLLALGEAAYNKAIPASTRMTPFWANYQHHLVMLFKALKQSSRPEFRHPI